MSSHADTILTGGRIFLGAGPGFAEALAVQAGKVMAFGQMDDLAGLAGPATRMIDLNGRCAVPGFNDAHQHLLQVGLQQADLALTPEAAPCLDDMLAAIAGRAAGLPPGTWIVGRDYDDSRLDVRRHPTRDEIDLVAPSHPVLITRTCGHAGVANSLALDCAGIAADARDPQGGRIGRREGRLTGLVEETALHKVQASLPRIGHEQLVAAVESGARSAARLGITSVTDPGVGLVQGPDEFDAYRAASGSGALCCRINAMILGGKEGWIERAQSMGLMTGHGDTRLRIGAAKLFADGSAGAGTAAMTRGYLNDPSNLGVLVHTDESLRRFVEAYHRAGWQVAIHGIGDRAIDQILDAYENALQRQPRRDCRHRIEHCGFVCDDQIERMRRLGVIAAPQPIFLHDFGDRYIEILGLKRSSSAYRMRTLIDAGLQPSASSDSPVCRSDPFANLCAMLDRRTRGGTVLDANETLSVAEALSAYSRAGAFGSFEDGIKGTLATGMLADIAVLDRDPFRSSIDEIRETHVDLTLLDGEVVHDRQGEL